MTTHIIIKTNNSSSQVYYAKQREQIGNFSSNVKFKLSEVKSRASKAAIGLEKFWADFRLQKGGCISDYATKGGFKDDVFFQYKVTYESHEYFNIYQSLSCKMPIISKLFTFESVDVVKDEYSCYYGHESCSCNDDDKYHVGLQSIKNKGFAIDSEHFIIMYNGRAKYYTAGRVLQFGYLMSYVLNFLCSEIKTFAYYNSAVRALFLPATNIRFVRDDFITRDETAITTHFLMNCSFDDYVRVMNECHFSCMGFSATLERIITYGEAIIKVRDFQNKEHLEICHFKLKDILQCNLWSAFIVVKRILNEKGIWKGDAKHFIERADSLSVYRVRSYITNYVVGCNRVEVSVSSCV